MSIQLGRSDWGREISEKQGNLNTKRHLKIKKKDVSFNYKSVLREKYRYKVLRYLGCILSDP